MNTIERNDFANADRELSMTQNGPTLTLHSVMLGVRDIDASLSFYTAKLGLTLKGRFGDFAFLEMDGATIVLSVQLHHARPALTRAPVEVVLAVNAVLDAYERLRARGVTFLNEPHTIDGINDAVNFEDPDGHLFSLFGPK